MDRVLACITPQSNSQRLIDKAALESEAVGGEFYILNVSRENSIFNSENSVKLLENLFAYGTQKGGSVHALCGDDIPSLICGFAKKNNITKIVLGETIVESGINEGIIEKIENYFRENNSDVEIIILKR